MNKPTKLEKVLAVDSKFLANEITKDVCKQFMEWSGYMHQDAPFELKADIYNTVINAINDAPNRKDS